MQQNKKLKGRARGNDESRAESITQKKKRTVKNGRKGKEKGIPRERGKTRAGNETQKEMTRTFKRKDKPWKKKMKANKKVR